MRVDGTRCLIAAASAARVPRFIAQSISFMCSPFGDGLTDEETPLHLDAPTAVRTLAEAIGSLETQTLNAPGMSGTVLRYGWFFGPGTNYDPRHDPDRYSRRHDADRGHRGPSSYINLQDAAAATINIVDHDSTGSTTSLMTHQFDSVSGCRSQRRFWMPPHRIRWTRPSPRAEAPPFITSGFQTIGDYDYLVDAHFVPAQWSRVCAALRYLAPALVFAYAAASALFPTAFAAAFRPFTKSLTEPLSSAGGEFLLRRSDTVAVSFFA